MAEKAKKGNQKKRLVLLDAHAIIHRAYHALPAFSSSKGEPTGALYGLAAMLMKIATDLSPDYVVACYDLPQPTFRHEAYDAYKKGRAKAEDDLIAQIKSSRRIFEVFGVPIYDMPGFEADDILGTVVTLLKGRKDIDIVIASGDMDTLQLVDGRHVQVYTLRKGIEDTVLYDEEKVMERFGFSPAQLPDYKGLAGDQSDNIIGVPGIGEKTASLLVQKFGTLEKLYAALAKDPAKLTEVGVKDRVIGLLREHEEEALFSKTLATIRRDAPIAFVLPDKEFKVGVDADAAEALFQELEFRRLINRFRELFGIAQPLAQKAEEVDPMELQRTSIALWVINSDINDASLEDVLLFAKKKTFAEAKEVVFETLKKEGVEAVYRELEEPIIPIVNQMQVYGVGIDQDAFRELSKEYHAVLDTKTAEIYSLAGGEFNINSPKQLAEVLFERLKLAPKGKRGAAGSFSTKAEVLEELAEENPVVRAILEYRELQKLLSTYIDVIPNMVGADGRLHARFIQHGTTTGRFSSQNPNMQNLPIKSELGRAVRKGFVAAPGKVLLAFDYSQVELRVLALLSGDPTLLAIFKEGKDIHTSVAARVFSVPEDKVDAEMRRRAKVINFGIIYGMGVNALKKNLGGTREEAALFYERYFTEFSRVAEYLEEVKAFARTHGYTETLFGRRRRFENIRSKIPYIKALAERMATNAPIQGTEADIIKLAIRFANERLERDGLLPHAHLVMQIHDELVYEVDYDREAAVAKGIVEAMQGVFEESYLKIQSPVPLIVHSASGKNLAETK